MTEDVRELPLDRLNELAAGALESARRWGNIAQLHHSRGESREATQAEMAETVSRRYADILAQRIVAAQQAARAEKAGA